jgi:tRNA pseudouridine55 synthase
MNGIIVLDKPPGMTSHDTVDAVRARARNVRVGHAGTLDPHATGVLILLLGKATKVSRFLMGLEKEYVFTMQLGLETDTLDRWGKTVRTVETKAKTEAEVSEAASSLTGRYDQVVPAVSALKHRGVRLYKLARRGEQVPTKVRSVEVRRFEILDVHHPFITARVVCSSGTYIRSLARDMGRLLGSAGCVFCLRRTRIGTFGLGEAVSLESVVENEAVLNDAVLPLSDALRHMPRVRMRREAVEGLRSGRRPGPDDFTESDLDFEGDHVVLTDEDGGVVAIARRTKKTGRLLETVKVL